jgi:hypothetical protein
MENPEETNYDRAKGDLKLAWYELRLSWKDLKVSFKRMFKKEK